jgi:hypothetical protein
VIRANAGPAIPGGSDGRGATSCAKVRLRTIGAWSAQYLATGDSKRFLLNRVPGDRAESPIVLVRGWRRRSERR